MTFSDDAYQALEDLARQRGTTMAEVLRDAIARERWFDTEIRSRKARLLVEDNGQVRELVFTR